MRFRPAEIDADDLDHLHQIWSEFSNNVLLHKIVVGDWLTKTQLRKLPKGLREIIVYEKPQAVAAMDFFESLYRLEDPRGS